TTSDLIQTAGLLPRCHSELSEAKPSGAEGSCVSRAEARRDLALLRSRDRTGPEHQTLLKNSEMDFSLKGCGFNRAVGVEKAVLPLRAFWRQPRPSLRAALA